MQGVGEFHYEVTAEDMEIELKGTAAEFSVTLDADAGPSEISDQFLTRPLSGRPDTSLSRVHMSSRSTRTPINIGLKRSMSPQQALPDGS